MKINKKIKRSPETSTRTGVIPARILKLSIKFIIDDFKNLINYCLEKGIFPVKLKNIADVSPIFKDLLVSFQIYQRFLKGLYTNKLTTS